MGLRIKIIIATFLIIISFIKITEAAWEGPVEIISGTWGSGDDQFGIKYGDINDVFAGPFYILSNGDIIIQDIIKNARYKVYGSNGTLKKVLKCVEISNNVYNEECNIDGEYIQNTADGSIWTDLSEHLKPKYSLYSPTGALIRTTTERPLELGKVSEKKTATGYTYTVQYPDLVNPNNVKTYTINLPGPYERFVRDNTGNINAIAGKAVRKFDGEEREIGAMRTPANEIRTIRPGGGGFEAETEVIAEYGEPVIAPNGDVYTWKRTPTAYSIIKWTWR